MVTAPQSHATGLVRSIIDARFMRGLAYAQPAPSGIDLNGDYGLQPALPLWQSNVPCCVGASCALSAAMLRPDLPILSMRVIWERGKRQLGWHGATGITLESGCTGVMPGAPSATDAPLDDQHPNDDEPEPVGLPQYDAVQGHRLILGEKQAGISASFAAGHPVMVGVAMNTNSFYMGFQRRYITEKGDGEAFCHAIVAYWRTPSFTVLRNHWGDAANTANPLPYEVRDIAQPCDVVFTNEAFDACAFELREMTGEIVEPAPIPNPEPQPEPDTKARALQIANDVEVAAAGDYAKQPRSTSRKYLWLGAQRVVTALSREL